MTKKLPFKTSDFVLAATLHYLDYEIKDVKPSEINPRRKEFYFDDSKELRKDIKNFWDATIRIEPMKFNTSRNVVRDYAMNSLTEPITNS